MAETSKADRVRAEARDVCAICEHSLWISFYFDAFGHHKDEDGSQVSNIGKLWDASLDIRKNGIFSNYYSGLGTNFDREAKAIALSVLKESTDKTKKEAKEKYEAEREAVKGTAKKVGSHLTQELVSGKPGWWERAAKKSKKELKELYYHFHDQLVLFRPGYKRDRWLRGIARHWRRFAEDVLHHPGRIHKHLKNEFFYFAGAVTAEQVGFIRDQKWLAMLFNTGVKSRLDQAEFDFENQVEVGLKLGTVKQINVAIFGADMGCALALAFANRLTQEICKHGKFKGVRVYVRFMGLFDCVCSRYDDNQLTSFVPLLVNEVHSDLQIPKAVEKVVHYAAAHEYRVFKPLSVIGGEHKPGARLEERLYPGDQQDVIGGHIPGDEGRKADLSRVPLNKMLNRAWRNGVPVQTLDKLEINAPKVFGQFRMDSEVETLVDQYWRKARDLATETKVIPLSNGALAQGYIDTGKSCMRLPTHPLTEKKLPANLKAELPGHQALFLAWIKGWYEQYPKMPQQQRRDIWRYEILDNEIKEMKRRSQYKHPLDPGSLDAESKKLWAVWQGNSATNAAGLDKLFNDYIHDSLADCLVERMWSDLIYSRQYFNHRLISDLKTQPQLPAWDARIWGSSVMLEDEVFVRIDIQAVEGSPALEYDLLVTDTDNKTYKVHDLVKPDPNKKPQAVIATELNSGKPVRINDLSHVTHDGVVVFFNISGRIIPAGERNPRNQNEILKTRQRSLAKVSLVVKYKCEADGVADWDWSSGESRKLEYVLKP